MASWRRHERSISLCARAARHAAARSRSTAALANMSRVLLMFATLTPGRLLLASWVVWFAAGILTAIPPLEGVAVAVGLFLVCGYPYIVILGLPYGVVRTKLRAAARILFFGFLLALSVLVVLLPLTSGEYSPPANPHSLSGWLELAAGLALNIVLFAPFFLGAAALNDLWRAARQDPTLQSVPNFLALYFGLFGGWLYIHRRVREALDVG